MPNLAVQQLGGVKQLPFEDTEFLSWVYLTESQLQKSQGKLQGRSQIHESEWSTEEQRFCVHFHITPTTQECYWVSFWGTHLTQQRTESPPAIPLSSTACYQSYWVQGGEWILPDRITESRAHVNSRLLGMKPRSHRNRINENREVSRKNWKRVICRE